MGKLSYKGIEVEANTKQIEKYSYLEGTIKKKRATKNRCKKRIFKSQTQIRQREEWNELDGVE